MRPQEKAVLFLERSEDAAAKAADPKRSEAFRRSWEIVASNWREESNRQQIIADFEEGLKTTLAPDK